MRRLLSSLFALLILAAFLAVVALFLVPDRVERSWRMAGLPPAPLEKVLGFTALGRTIANNDQTRLYGVLETRQTYAMSEVPGRVAELLVEEGDVVTAGQTLITLDPADALAEVEAAAQGVASAESNRDAVAAPPPASTVALADAAVAAAETRLDNSLRSLEQARRALEQPLDISAEVNRASTLLPAVEAAIGQAEAEAATVRVQLESASRDGSRDGKALQVVLQKQLEAAQANITAAQARRDGLASSLAILKRMRQDPIGLEARVNAAEQEVKLAEAALALARAERESAAAPPLAQAVAVAETQIHAAKVGLELARWQADRQTVTAPAEGKVVASMVEPGETVQAGAPLISLADQSEMEVRAYVALQDLPRVQLGDTLPVEVVAVPDGKYEGVITFIASEAQFRPNNVLNLDDRGDMVFLIKVRVENPGETLKAGMPADILLPLD